ncbi:class I SAM-dependent methyltransferase [Nocardia sp. NPDC060259]|uniref:class I SAM-dependent methyltransferase n=1 Tax=Nocardia sp. NPDC060259 TaxID=3347088 RepID=UPI0036500AD0
MTRQDWASSFFDDGYEETFRRLGKYDTTDADVDAILALTKLPVGSRVLDVPCGWGRHTGRLHKLGYDAVGVDSSPAQISLAHQRWPSVTFHLNDMRDIPSGPFDAVFNLWTSFGSLPTASEDLDALRAWKSGLAPGGVLVMELTTYENAARTNEAHGQPNGYKSVTVNDVREDAVFDWDNGVSRNTYTRGDWTRTCITRLYRRPALRDLLHRAGFRAVEMYGSFGGDEIDDTRRTVLIAR